MYSLYFKMTYVYCIMYSIQCILYSVWCIVYNIHYTISSMDPQWMLGVTRNLLSRKSYHMPVTVSRGTAVSARMTSRLAVLLLPVTTGVIVILITVLLEADDVLSTVQCTVYSVNLSYFYFVDSIVT